MLSAQRSHSTHPELLEGCVCFCVCVSVCVRAEEDGKTARLKMKQEKTFHRELFTGHDSRGLRRPFTACSAPGYRTRVIRVPEQPVRLDPVAKRIFFSTTLRCRHGLVFATPAKSCSQRRIRAAWTGVYERQGRGELRSGRSSSGEVNGVTGHLAKPSGGALLRV